MNTTKRCIITALILWGLHAPLDADTLYLKSGFQIHGKVSEQRSTPKDLILEIDGVGAVTISRDQVRAVEKNDQRGIAAPQEGQPVQATLKDMVAVRMKKGHGYYGAGPLYGVTSKASNDQTLVLTIPGVGETRIPREAVERVEPLEPRGLLRETPAAAGTGPIRTTHVVLLKNGSRLTGTVVPTPPAEPLKLELGSLGVVLIPRDRIEKVEEASGEIRLPEPEAEPAAPPAAPAAEGAPAARSEPAAPPAMDPALRAEVQESIYELTRWRSRNRVRAERKLVAIGAPAIPLLRQLARDPFELTRRAAMRVVRDVADPEGTPMAIEGLLDEDGFVREAAADALQRITGLNFGYHPHASPSRRLEAYRRWREWWESQAAVESR